MGERNGRDEKGKGGGNVLGNAGIGKVDKLDGRQWQKGREIASIVICKCRQRL